MAIMGLLMPVAGLVKARYLGRQGRDRLPVLQAALPDHLDHPVHLLPPGHLQ